MQRFHQPKWIASDPVQFVYRSNDWKTQEALAVIAAMLSYGRVEQILKHLEELIETHLGGPKQLKLALEGNKPFLFKFVYRLHHEEHLIGLLDLLRETWRVHGSLGQFLIKCKNEQINAGAPNPWIGAISMWIQTWRRWARDKSPGGRISRGLLFFLNDPMEGSACKRWMMFLRWATRRDHVDPGFWTGLMDEKELAEVRSQLIIPLDTHVLRIANYLNLTNRMTSNWKTAVEITHSLSKVYPSDPVCVDFSVARLGILNLCQKRFEKKICPSCELVSVCRFACAKLGA